MYVCGAASTRAVWGGARLLQRRPLPALAAGMVGVLLLGFAAFVMGSHPLWGVVLALGACRLPFHPLEWLRGVKQSTSA